MNTIDLDEELSFEKAQKIRSYLNYVDTIILHEKVIGLYVENIQQHIDNSKYDIGRTYFFDHIFGRFFLVQDTEKIIIFSIKPKDNHDMTAADVTFNTPSQKEPIEGIVEEKAAKIISKLKIPSGKTITFEWRAESDIDYNTLVSGNDSRGIFIT